ncbi:hypothetical protein SAMCCGM7_pC0554 (plasmid) [Sinorhizobium americanum CCGM7]|nr:hypothetical protein SAMCCGM7_pC0554 [Sinorhizobium americanum CCGM7]
MGCDQLPVIHLTCSCGRKSLSTIRGMSFLVMPMLEQPVVQVVKRGGRPPPLSALQRT